MTKMRGLSGQLTDIRECDKEALHLFSAIQDHGYFVTFSWPDQRIQNVSENIERFIHKSHREILGSRLDQILDVELVNKIASLVKEFPWKLSGHHIQHQIDSKTDANIYLFETEDLFALEFEYSPAKSLDQEIDGQRILKDFTLEAKQMENLEALGNLVCRTIRRISGFDHAMIYKFLEPSWHGEVIAEDRVTTAQSYLRHRFPSSDIPKPARDLYLRNQVRLISDVHGKDSRILPGNNPYTKKPLNMANSRLRSVAKVHIEYLKNMGVGASFSVSITVDEKLWGLIACHHPKAHYVSQSQRSLCEIIAHIFAIHAQLMEEVKRHNDQSDFNTKLKNVFENLRLSNNPLDQLFRQHRTLSDAFNIGGLALVSDDVTDFAGMTPLRVDIEALAKWLKIYMYEHNKKILAVNSISEIAPEFERLKDQACGVLAAFIPDAKESMLLFFRPEIVQTVIWGGDPRKQLDAQNFQGRVNPRESFKAWEEVIKNQATPWQTYEIEGISFIRDFVFEVLIKKDELIRELSEDLKRARQP